VLKALNYLENKNIAHRDLKPENIVYSPTDKIKINDIDVPMIKLIDFGFAKESNGK
jgi:serine/threonine protein kinase